MKKLLFTLIPALALVFLIASCSKDDTTNTQANSTPVGTWSGTGQYGTAVGAPTYAFSLTFKANGTVSIVGDNNTGIDVATGTWTIVQDSVRAFYRYANSSADYVLSGKFSAGATVMNGTIGLGTATAGAGLFSVSKQN